MLIEIAGDKNPGEVFKKEECWKALKQRTGDWGIERVDKKTLSSLSNDVVGSELAENNIARCMKIPPEEWTKIAQWGQESGKLHFSQIGIALSLFRLSSANWKKTPSEKQAKSGVKILQSFEDNQG